MVLTTNKTGALIKGAPGSSQQEGFEMAKYVCKQGCMVSGERLRVGEEVTVTEKITAEKIKRLLAMGRIVDVSTADGKAELSEAVAAAKVQDDLVAKANGDGPAAKKAPGVPT